MRMTEFRPVVGEEGHYEVNGLGMVWSIPRVIVKSDGRTYTARGGFRKPCIDRAGYLFVILRGRQRYIHQLVAEAFIGPRPAGLNTCHNNGDRADNRISNLRYDTPKGNMADKLRHGTLPRGEEAGRAKLSEDEVRSIFVDPRLHREIAADHCISAAYVSSLKSGRYWSHLNLAKEVSSF